MHLDPLHNLDADLAAEPIVDLAADALASARQSLAAVRAQPPRDTSPAREQSRSPAIETTLFRAARVGLT